MFLMLIVLLILVNLFVVYCEVVRSEVEAIAISNNVFRFLDRNKDNLLTPVEWNLTSSLPRNYKFINNEYSRIPFSDVDANKNGLLERNELSVFVTGLLMVANDTRDVRLFIDYHKIKEYSKLLFKKSFEHECRRNITNSDDQWDLFMQCIRFDDAQQCIVESCKSKNYISRNKHIVNDNQNDKEVPIDLNQVLSNRIIMYVLLALSSGILANVLVVEGNSLSMIEFLYPVSGLLLLSCLFLSMAFFYSTKIH